jgi:hypothetical protein
MVLVQIRELEVDDFRRRLFKLAAPHSAKSSPGCPPASTRRKACIYLAGTNNDLEDAELEHVHTSRGQPEHHAAIVVGSVVVSEVDSVVDSMVDSVVDSMVDSVVWSSRTDIA